MPNELTKAIQIIVNELKLLGKKIESLPNTKKTDKVEVKIPPTLRVPPIDTRAIERIIKDGLENQKNPIVNIPKQDPPIVNLPAPIVNVEPAKIEFPREMEVKEMKVFLDKIEELLNKEPENPFNKITSGSPIPIKVIDKSGKQVSNFGGDMTAPSVVGLKTGTTQVSSTNPLPITDGFQLPEYDEITLAYDGSDNLTSVVYKLNDATIATLTLSYTSGNLTGVVKS